ncbi:MBL fold metallo-hydrolase [Pleurocapsa sp. CCALA 161]|uniref:MBL fold metallo-hydrolase n=1 Tax=Pleurocapsa sp. CCALA 161 TaxID=2107688 RepID=UPI000D055A09|nr:MBL fold metallo-hydrolase [Pleurocapsa sp. CCALA 161]PSB10912.1 MBL fold metallo-hydrolase [Pleurocapsa sp. CCALA 161]
MPQNWTEITASLGSTKIPRLIVPGIFAFTPNRDTLGATSYLIVDKIGNILFDCPAWNEANQQFIQSQGGVQSLIISHRGGIGKNVLQMQQALSCQVILQEQEAYLLPEVEVTSFGDGLTLRPDLELIWTPGHSPGSSCLYYGQQGGILFTGRHLLPKSPEEIVPLRTPKTFHWNRQLNSIARLRDRFDSTTLKYVMPGANTGYLRGKGYLDNAYEQLSRLDLTALRFLEPI